MAATELFVFIFQITCKAKVIQSQMVEYVYYKEISRVCSRAHLHHIAQYTHVQDAVGSLRYNRNNNGKENNNHLGLLSN